MNNILKWFFWDYNGENFFEYVFWNVHGLHFDINPVFLMCVIVDVIALNVIATIVFLIARKISPKVRQSESIEKKWKCSLVVAACLIVVCILFSL